MLDSHQGHTATHTARQRAHTCTYITTTTVTCSTAAGRSVSNSSRIRMYVMSRRLEACHDHPPTGGTEGQDTEPGESVQQAWVTTITPPRGSGIGSEQECIGRACDMILHPWNLCSFVLGRFLSAASLVAKTSTKLPSARNTQQTLIGSIDEPIKHIPGRCENRPCKHGAHHSSSCTQSFTNAHRARWQVAQILPVMTYLYYCQIVFHNKNLAGVPSREQASRAWVPEGGAGGGGGAAPDVSCATKITAKHGRQAQFTAIQHSTSGYATLQANLESTIDQSDEMETDPITSCPLSPPPPGHSSPSLLGSVRLPLRGNLSVKTWPREPGRRTYLNMGVQIPSPPTAHPLPCHPGPPQQ